MYVIKHFFCPDRAEYLVLYVFEKMLIATYEVYRSKFSLHTVFPCYVRLSVADIVNIYR